MKLLLTILLFMFSTPAMAGLLDQYKWENRLLIMHAPSVDANAYKVQMDDYRAHQAGVEDRDMKLVALIAEEPLDEYDAWASAFHLKNDEFAVILVGKDGTEKQRWSSPVAMETVFDIIDSMPMRVREMRDSE